MTKLGTYLDLKRIWNRIDFQGQRSRSQGLIFRRGDMPRFALPLMDFVLFFSNYISLKLYCNDQTLWGRKAWTDIANWTAKPSVLGMCMETLTFQVGYEARTCISDVSICGQKLVTLTTHPTRPSAAWKLPHIHFEICVMLVMENLNVSVR